MIIESISPSFQNLLMYSFEQLGKLFLIVLPLVLSLIYLYHTHKEEEETPYILIGWTRVLYYWLSKTYIFISPITIFALHPFFDFWTIANLLIIFYSISLVVGTIVILFNILYWSPQILFKIMGYNPTLKGQSKALNKIQKQWGIGKHEY